MEFSSNDGPLADMPLMGYNQGMAEQAFRFADRLRELREAAGLTQVQLAEKAGMHLHGYTKLEHGDREPSWATVQALAGALGVDCRAFTVPPSTVAERERGRPAKPKPDEPKPKRSRGRPRKEK